MENNDFDALGISLASPELIRSWSYGEVTKPETINYRTLKPEKNGLFCERIFGPVKDFECACGKYKKIRYKGVICDRCGVEVTWSKVRRERMGHIDLAAPVTHVWFAKGTPSPMALLLDISPRNLDHVLYFAQYIVIRVDEEGREREIKRLKEKALEVRELEKKEIEAKINELNELCPLMLFTESRYRELKEKYGDIFEAGRGAEAILEILQNFDLEKEQEKLLNEINSTSGQRQRKAIKRLYVVEAFRRSGNKPEWMILRTLPVLPPDLRPMVQLDGGRFATSDLNDLYRRVINRNNRLKRLLELKAPGMIIRNEKRMLQEAVDSLIDNGRQRRAVTRAGNHPLKSRSEVLRGKQGRFRQNLLGKRVDYSGRSVIVVGPELKLHQCGLPKRMALELFKPFVMARLVREGIASNIKSAKRIVEGAKPEVWGILEEVVKERLVLLNRAPTLHRLSIQAFEPVLIEGSAIQLHPLVCPAFNADFDGDQMAVHVPLSKLAVKEAREMMLSTKNLLLPSSGEPIIAPTLDIVLGCYYLTSLQPGAKGEGAVFGSFEEVELAYNLDIIDLRAEIEVRQNGERLKTSVGRIIFNNVLPKELRFINKTVDKSSLRQIIARCLKSLGNEITAQVADNIKELGFHYATKSGTTIAANDVKVPQAKPKILEEAEKLAAQIEDQYNGGLITEDEHYDTRIKIWTDTTDKITEVLQQSMDHSSGVYMMMTSGAKGNISQVKQMAGMRGLMTDPSGRIVDFPIRSSFYEGLPMLEYFISSHGARKGLADTALKTSDSGYLTRRLVDVTQDALISEEDCGTLGGIWLTESMESFLAPFAERIIGRLAASKIIDPKTNCVIVNRNEEIDEEKAKEIISAGITQVYVRSPLTCQSRDGICQCCYGRDLARGHLVNKRTAVGIIAAQSIGEPGTQLTLRTFHTGGIVGVDITSGLPRVEELLEARVPKGQAILSGIDGVADIFPTEEGHRIKIAGSQLYGDEYLLPPSSEWQVKEGEGVEVGAILAQPKEGESLAITLAPPLLARVAGEVSIEGNRFIIIYEEKEKEEHLVPFTATLQVKPGDEVKAGDQLTGGSINPQDILRIKGREAVQRYLVDEMQKVYRSQGVNINDKHIEVVVRQMLRKVRVDNPGDTKLIYGQLIDRFLFEDINARVIAEGGEPATAHSVLLGITKAALHTESFLSAASFQETTRVLTDAAINGKIDVLQGIKENVIIGRSIPARCLSEEIEKETKPTPLQVLESKRKVTGPSL